MNTSNQKNVTPERIIKLLAKCGQHITVEDAKKVQQFLYMLAIREVHKYLKL